MEYVPSILDLLDLEYIEENLYRACGVFGEPRRLYGGQVAAQALYAAGRTVPAERLPHSLHGYFLRQGSTVRPTVFQVERDRDGHSFSARRVVAIQEGEVIFNMSASFAAPQAGADRDAAAPELPVRDPLPRWNLPRHPSFEVRTSDTGRRLPVRFWLRSVVELPADPLLHAAVLTYASDLSRAWWRSKTARPRRGRVWTTPSGSTARRGWMTGRGTSLSRMPCRAAAAGTPAPSMPPTARASRASRRSSCSGLCGRSVPNHHSERLVDFCPWSP